MEQELMAITSGIKDNLNIPDDIVRIPIEERQKNTLQWKNAWLISMWKGDHLYPAQVINAIQTKWKVTNDKSIMTPVGRNRFVCKIHAKEDNDRVQSGQPWQAMNCLIIMEPFSSPTNPDSVILDKIPLWICFDGLLLEHYNRITVGRVASAAGSVVSILPEDESIERGDTWVAFRYPNLPALHCKKCDRVGHQKHACTFSSLQDPKGKEVHNLSTQMEDVSQADWPHKHMPNKTLNQPMDLENNQVCQNVLEETICTKPIDQSNQTLHIWDNAGNLDKVDQRELKLGSRRSGKAQANLTQTTPITDPFLLSHSIRITEIPNPPLIILDDEKGSQPSKRKGRNPIQKKNKTFTNKGKSAVTLSLPDPYFQKKRKVMEFDSLTNSSTLSPLHSSTNDFNNYIQHNPPHSFPTAIKNYSQITPPLNQHTALINPDQISLEQMIQLLSTPAFSNKLVPCGLLSPIISHLLPQWGSHHISQQIAGSSQLENTDEWGNTHCIQRNNEFVRNAYTNNSKISKVDTQLHLCLNQISEIPTQSLQLDSPTSVIHSELLACDP
ncbi:hypothetical protein FRX31_030399 [Thalictrum thalictroides]|uniref:DUF4283 domain-containing protein n=1 Tax=Thalictrum thalictroides TaxID=46969 RepID=A0A7J6V5P6_THATH|nr:hypothetical protein FRX31_030399 [Thalictrum thalictroides]